MGVRTVLSWCVRVLALAKRRRSGSAGYRFFDPYSTDGEHINDSQGTKDKARTRQGFAKSLYEGPSALNSPQRRYLPEIELDQPVRAVEVAIVVRDDDDGLAAVLQVGEQFGVKHLAEPWLLVGGPLVE